MPVLQIKNPGAARGSTPHLC